MTELIHEPITPPLPTPAPVILATHKTLIDDHGGDWFYPEFLEQISDFLGLPHVTTSTTVGQLESTSHQADGSAFFGTGNSTLHYLNLFDHTSNIEFGLEAHYRTGDYVTPVKNSGNWIATLASGHQDGTHNEQGTNLTRSAASVDLSLNFGNENPTNGKFVLDVNGHDYILDHTGTGATAQWFMENTVTHAPAIGLTLAPGSHVLQDSVNFGFAEFAYLAHNGPNSGDLAPQNIHITLTEMVGHVGVAAVSETLHLV
jgi:hypothetical protein